MLNFTSEVRGVGGGAFLRVLEPLEGIDMMQSSREATRLIDLASGPGRLTETMRVDLRTGPATG
jgi:DNA-3-methyladenine glycosylase